METSRKQPITTEGGFKLYPLLVKDPSVIDLVELINEPDFHEPEDDDDAGALLGWLFWALLIVTCGATLYLMGLVVGSGN